METSIEFITQEPKTPQTELSKLFAYLQANFSEMGREQLAMRLEAILTDYALQHGFKLEKDSKNDFVFVQNILTRTI